MHAVKRLASEWGCCDRFQVKKKHFFLNVVAIMLSGVVVVFYFFAIISAGMGHPIELSVFLLDDTSPS
jgi:hypothetical protein